MPTTQPCIAVAARGITKDFSVDDKTTRVLHGIDIQLYQGELVMLVGPSGCGKTTLLSIMTGILTPTAGNVLINNINITTLNEDEKVLLRRKEIGFVFQQYNLFASLTAAENAAVPLIAANVPINTAIEKASVLLSKIGMEKNLNKYPANLSGGEQQRVAIARALVHEPRLIVCDEPTSALDAQTGQEIMKILKHIALEPERTVIVVTHDTRVFHFANRILYMNDGYIEQEKPEPC
jgi:putative ABC transport system ATP-binding protein